MVPLPWSTSNEDLVELFTTIGKVEGAESQDDEDKVWCI